MSRRLLVLAVAGAITLPAFAASDERTALTLYRAESDQLFATNGEAVSGDGYAVVHERRSFDLKGGAQDLSIDGLPSALDSEALSLRFPGKGTRVSVRLPLNCEAAQPPAQKASNVAHPSFDRVFEAAEALIKKTA